MLSSIFVLLIFLLLFFVINCSNIVLKLNYLSDNFYPYYKVVYEREKRETIPIFKDNNLDDKLSVVMFHNNNNNNLSNKNILQLLKHDRTTYSFDNTTIINKRVNYECDEHIYNKLYACLINEESCYNFSLCINNIHCTTSILSHSSLIMNLLKHLDMNNCETDILCSHEKRLHIFRRLLNRWTTIKRTNFIIHNTREQTDIDTKYYCNTMVELIKEVYNQVEQECPSYLNSTQIFTKQYYCHLKLTDKFSLEHVLNTVSTFSMIDQTQKEAQVKVHTEQTTITNSVSKFKEYDDEDLNFISLNRLADNSTQQNVFVNDHLYYNVSYLIPKLLFTSNIINFVRDNDIKGQIFSQIHALSNKHRSAFSMSLSFPFPFYGHTIKKILVATGGFIYTGDLVYAALIGSTQYIAPFMSDFYTSFEDNQSKILYLDNGTHFIVTWNKVYLQDQQEIGPYTFQAILQDNGNIYFNYVRIPTIKMFVKHHTFRVGLSDAFMLERPTLPFHIVRIITLYHKIDGDIDKIKNGTSILFEMDNSCNTFSDCTSCLANRNGRYNCSWCDDVQRCSDGYDRRRNEWFSAQCHRTASKDYCSVLDYKTATSFNDKQGTSTESSIIFDDIPLKRVHQQKLSPIKPKNHVRTIIFKLIISILVGVLLAIMGVYIYAYRHPTSTSGIWLIEHRPQNFTARFKRFSHRNDTMMS